MAEIVRDMKIALYSRMSSDANRTKIGRLRSILCAKGVEIVPSVEESDLVLSLGGDGTFLESLRLVRNSGVPVAGVNFGRLGFLTSASSDEDFSWVDRIVNGDYTVRERALLKMEMEGFEEYPYAMNEFSVQRRGANMLGVDLRLNGRAVPTYWADGVVISTPTGSTAYSMSVGGPVVMPDSDVLVIAPIAPHNLNVRPLVVPMETVVDVSFRARDGVATVSLDNRSYDVGQGTRIRIVKGEFGFRYVSLCEDSFITALQEKLLWGEDRRNAK